MEISANKFSISELSLEELFPKTLTDTSCVYIDKASEVWVATEMCAHYIESVVDSIVVQDNGKPIGIVGGYDLLDHLRKNPTRDFQYHHKVEEIMFTGLPQIEKKTKLKDLVKHWKNSRRAFAIISNETGEYFPISARKMLELGAKCKTDISVSSMPKKKIITFHSDDSLGKILDLMFENKTRKLVLENSNQFISDRLILAGIANMLKFQKDIDRFLDIPINQFRLEQVRVIKEDLRFNNLCSIMDKMDHPFVVYNDMPVTPWDVCLTLLSEGLTLLDVLGYQKKIKCPHCGKDISL
jgi:predicted transcriptional regulator